MATIRIPTPLRPYAGGTEYIEVTGQTVGEVLDDLTRRFPDLRPHLFNDGKLRSFVNVFVGEEDVRYLDGLETPITENDRLLIVPSVAGG
jgi:molybdopterin converting factor small subunit